MPLFINCIMSHSVLVEGKQRKKERGKNQQYLHHVTAVVKLHELRLEHLEQYLALAGGGQ